MLGSYRRLFDAPHVRRLELFSLIGRIQNGAAALALTIYIASKTGSLANAGLAVGAFGLTTGMASPLKGRWIDRYGARSLVPLALVHSGLYVLMIAIPHLGAAADSYLYVAVAALIGATRANLTTYMRAIWMRVHPNDSGLQQSAMVFESTMTPVILTLGPLIVSSFLLIGGEELALLMVAATAFVGTLGFCLSPLTRLDRQNVASPSLTTLQLLRLPGLMRVMALGAAIYLSFGFLQLGIPAFAYAQGSRPAAGLLLSVMAASSFVGGVIYGARRWPGTAAQQLSVIMALYGISLLAVGLGDTITTMAVVMVVVGFLNAPIGAGQMQVVAERSPEEAINEALAWNTTVGLVAGAAGSALGGVAVSHGGTMLLMAAASAPILVAFAVFTALERRA